MLPNPFICQADSKEDYDKLEKMAQTFFEYYDIDCQGKVNFMTDKSSMNRISVFPSSDGHFVRIKSPPNNKQIKLLSSCPEYLEIKIEDITYVVRYKPEI